MSSSQAFVVLLKELWVESSISSGRSGAYNATEMFRYILTTIQQLVLGEMKKVY